MRIERFAVIAAFTLIIAGGCASSRTSQNSSYQHSSGSESGAADYYQADPPAVYQPQEGRAPLQPVPVPPAMGVSHVKRVGYMSQIGFSKYFGQKSECAAESTCSVPEATACATEACTSEACCGENTKSCFSPCTSLWKMFCPKKQPCCVEEPCCESATIVCNPHPLYCRPRTACIPHVNCVEEYCQPLCEPGCTTESGCSTEGCDTTRSCLFPSLKLPAFKMPTCKLPQVKMPTLKMPHMKFASATSAWKSCWSKKCTAVGCTDSCVEEGCGSLCAVEPSYGETLCRPSHGLSPLAAPLQDPFAGNADDVDVQQQTFREPVASQAVPEIPQQQLPEAPAPAQPAVGKPEPTPAVPAPVAPAPAGSADALAPVPAPTIAPSQSFVEPNIWPRLKPASQPFVRHNAEVRAWSTSWQSQ